MDHTPLAVPDGTSSLWIFVKLRHTCGDCRTTGIAREDYRACGERCCILPIKFIDQECPAIMQQDRATMRTDRRSSSIGKRRQQSALLIGSQLPSTTQG